MTKRLCFFILALCGVTMLPLWINHAQTPTPRPQTQPPRGQTARPALSQLPSADKRWAIVIGVDDYDDTAISRLSGAVNDAKALADALKTYGGFRDERVTLLASDQPRERRPTRGTILKRLANLKGALPPDGLLLFAFAGHGIERNGQSFLLPADAQDSRNVSLLEETSLNVERLKLMIRETGVQQVFVILDACRNDPSAGRSNGDNLMTGNFSRSFDFDTRNREVEAFVTLYATSVGARSYEYSEKGQGYFTWSLIEGLKGRAANERGEVTLGNLVSHLERVVPDLVQRDLGARQRPFAQVEGYRANDLVLAVTAVAPTKPVLTIGSKRQNAYGMEFTYIPAGSFEMGSTDAEIQLVVNATKPTDSQTTPGWFKNEKPQHRVTISQPFFMGVAEVTQKQWQDVMGTTVQQQRDKKGTEYVLSNIGPSQPMYYVSWEEAQAFVQKLNELNDGNSYRLPTEAEWEYAARAGSKGDYAGNLDAMAWYGDNSGKVRRDSLAEWVKSGRNAQKYFEDFWKPNDNGTHDVRTKDPNAFGLYDMHGNVWEWCQDWYGDYATGAQTDPTGATSGQYRVLRGGSWIGHGVVCRSAVRFRNTPGDRGNAFGFRVVMTSRTQAL